MEPVSSMTTNPLYEPPKAADTKAARNEQSENQENREAAGKHPLRPDRDEYIPETKRALAQDKPQGPDRKAAGGNVKKCRVSTEKVDREIEKLKKEKEELERQLNLETDERKAARLEKRLAQVESELRQKDTDAYRRQHMTRSFS